MNRYCLFVILFAFLIQATLVGQECIQDDTLYDSDSDLMNVFYEVDVKSEEELTNDMLQELEENPVDLNECSVEELSNVPMITSTIAQRIIERRNKMRFTKLKELLEIEGITKESYSIIRRFVKIIRSKKHPESSLIILNRVYKEIEKKAGYLNGAYLGSSLKMLNRFRLVYESETEKSRSILNRTEIGGQIEKDPGEVKFTNYSTFYCSMSFSRIPFNVIVGDYGIRASQGLVLWDGIDFSNFSDAKIFENRNGEGMRPHRSTDENMFFRGVSTNIDLKYINAQFFYSFKKLNATVDTTGIILNIDNSGLFRTKSELGKYHSASEKVMGYRTCEYILPGLRLGQTGYVASYSNQLLLKNGTTRQGIYMHGYDFSFTKGKACIFAEVAMDVNRKRASVFGILYNPEPSITMSILSRKYPSCFESIYGNFFTMRDSYKEDEEGVYCAIGLKLFKNTSIYSYYDQFKLKNYHEYTIFTGCGNRFLFKIESKISDNLTCYLRFTRKNSPELIETFDSYGRTMKILSERAQNNIKLVSYLNSSSDLQLMTSAEIINVFYDKRNNESGAILWQEVKWLIKEFLSIRFRVSGFETDSYDSRLYDWEEDSPGVYTSKFVYGQGIKWFLLMNFSVLKKYYFSLKYTQMIKGGVKYIGSGLDRIEGNEKSAIYLQLKIDL